MVKIIVVYIWLICLVSLAYLGSSQENEAGLWYLTLINNASDLHMSWDIVTGFTLDAVNIPNRGSQIIRIKTNPLPFNPIQLPYKFYRTNSSVKMRYGDYPYEVIVPCQEYLKCLVDNESLEVGNVLTKLPENGSMHTLKVSNY